MRKVEAELSKGYSIRFARYEDIDNIMCFFREYWGKTHILANDRDFFEYEFYREGELCFVLLFNPDEKIEGTLGYIPYEDDDRDIFIVMWKVLQNHQVFAGVGMLNYLIENGRCRHIYTSGLRENTKSIYRYMGFQTGQLSHYYMLNGKCVNKIAIIRNTEEINRKVPDSSRNIELKEISDENEFIQYYKPEQRKDKIRKSMGYMLHRYFHNPKYQYLIYQIMENDEKTSSFVIAREQKTDCGSILRIIDFVGDERQLQFIGKSICELLDKNQYEYADMYAFGIKEDILLQAGFSVKEEDSDNIIPDYFHPFERKNVRIGIFWEKDTQPLIFKGDGDQDRPSE